MLTKIICDKFKKDSQEITFTSGLNVILGDNNGTNSIGKSTFLMIIDFVFGGDDYIKKLSDVQRNIGFHRINFSFMFDNQDFFYSRATDSPEIISVCDTEYKKLSTISNSDFTKSLKEKYKIESLDLSFRSAISVFFRIYGRDNLDEKRPLQVYSGEGGEECVKRLIKLYNEYNNIAELEILVANKKDELNSYKASQKYGYVPNITKQQFLYNKKEIEKNKQEIQTVASDMDKGIVDIESLETKEVLTIKNKIIKLKRKLSHYESKKEIYSEQIDDLPTSNRINESFYNSLIEFFPSIEIRKLEDVDSFHKGLVRILNSEIKNQISELDSLINNCKEEIEKLYNELNHYGTERKISTVVLKKIEALVVDKNKLTAETESYVKLQSLNKSKKNVEERLDKELTQILAKLQNVINLDLENLNSNLFIDKKQSPTISMTRKNYTYFTFDDSGTGTNYKNLIILDMCIFKQTFLPAIIHDSLLFKNIGDEPLQNIFKNYSLSTKQVFIAFDRQDTYLPETQQLLEKACILHLGAETDALFGRTWNKKYLNHKEQPHDHTKN